MSTIDHKQEAVHMLDHSNRYGTPIEAQAHATLCLAEQQRIANLIAYLSIPSGDVQFNARGIAVLVQIEEGLGLA